MGNTNPFVAMIFIWLSITGTMSLFTESKISLDAKNRNTTLIAEAINSTSSQPNRSVILTICGNDSPTIHRQIQSLLSLGFTFRGTLNNPIDHCSNVLFIKP